MRLHTIELSATSASLSADGSLVSLLLETRLPPVNLKIKGLSKQETLALIRDQRVAIQMAQIREEAQTVFN